MIDSLQLYVRDYSIEGNNNLTVQPASYNSGTGEIIGEHALFRNEEGREFKGSKAFLNTSRLNLDIKPVPFGIGCFIKFSVPKIHNGNNFYSVGEQGTKAVVGMVEKELFDNGFHTSLNEAGISRIDTFKNIQAEEPFSSYYGLFGMLKARRAIQRGYGTTFLVHNTQQEFCIYDKLVEMESRGIKTSSFPANSIRFEHRLLNKKKVHSVYGFSKVEDMFLGGYEVIRNNQVEEWKKSLFSYSVGEVVMLGSKQLETEMEWFKKTYKYYWFEKFLKAYGSYHLAEVAGVEVVKVALSNLEADRLKIYRASKLLEEAKREIEMVKKQAGTEKTLSILYQELKDKVCLN